MGNAYTGLFQTLSAAFNEASLAKEGRNAMLMYCTRDFSPEIAAPFSVVNTNICASTGSASHIASGSSLTLSDVTMNAGAVTLDKHPAYGFNLPSFDTARGPSASVVEKLRDEAIKKMGDYANGIVAALVNGTAFNSYATVTSASDDAWDDASIKSAWTTLANADVPVGDLGNVFFVTKPTAYAALLDTGKWSQSAYIGSDLAQRVRATAALGTQWGAFCDWDPDLPTVSGKQNGLFFHRNAIALVSRALAPPANPSIPTTYVSYKGIPIRVTIDFNNKTLADEIVFDALFGVAAIRPDHGVYMETA
jgi:hypothetical protein